MPSFVPLFFVGRGVTSTLFQLRSSGWHRTTQCEQETPLNPITNLSRAARRRLALMEAELNPKASRPQPAVGRSVLRAHRNIIFARGGAR